MFMLKGASICRLSVCGMIDDAIRINLQSVPHEKEGQEQFEENLSLEHADLDIRFAEHSFRNSKREVPIKNRLRTLSISSSRGTDLNALISKITVQKGAHLKVDFNESQYSGLNDIRSVVSMTHLSNLRSPTFMEYCPTINDSTFRLVGPNGSFTATRRISSSIRTPLGSEFPLLPLKGLRTFHLRSDDFRLSLKFPPLFFPALETLVIIAPGITLSHFLSSLFSNPSASPSLKTLAFLDCCLDETFMQELKKYSSDRKETTSARLHRIVIVDSKGELPPFPLIDNLGKYVPIVDVRVGKELPPDLR